MINRVFYFGCLRETGHHWFGEDAGSTFRLTYSPSEIPREFWAERIDGRLPPREWDDGISMWTLRVRGEVWTAAAWWDQTVDKRPGSHSVLLTSGEPSIGELILEGADRFPELRERISRFMDLDAP